MEWWQTVLAIVGGVTVVTGAIGGVWSLVDRLVAWRESKQPIGYRKKGFLVVHRKDLPDGGIEADFLITGDWFAALRVWLENQGTEVLSMETLGPYLRVKMKLPTGQFQFTEQPIPKNLKW